MKLKVYRATSALFVLSAALCLPLASCSDEGGEAAPAEASASPAVPAAEDVAASAPEPAPAPAEEALNFTADDFLAAFDQRLAIMQELDMSNPIALGKQFARQRPMLVKVLKGEERGTLTVLAAQLGSIPAMKYAQKEMGQEPRIEAMEMASRLGNVEMMRYLCEDCKLKEEDRWMGYTLEAAARAGQLEVCKYLVEEMKLDAKDIKLAKELMSDRSQYDVARVQRYFTEKTKTTNRDVSANQLEVLKYLISCGLDMKDEKLKSAEEDCRNSLIRDYLREQGLK